MLNFTLLKNFYKSVTFIMMMPVIINLRINELKQQHKTRDIYSIGYYAHERISKLITEEVHENLSEIEKIRYGADYILSQLYWSDQKFGLRIKNILCSKEFCWQGFKICLHGRLYNKFLSKRAHKQNLKLEYLLHELITN